MGDLLFIIYGYSYVTIHHYVMITLYYGIALTISLFKRIFSKLILSLHKTVALSCTEWFGLTPFAIHHQTHCERKRSKLQVCLLWYYSRLEVHCIFLYKMTGKINSNIFSQCNRNVRNEDSICHTSCNVWHHFKCSRFEKLKFQDHIKNENFHCVQCINRHMKIKKP